MTKNKKKPSKGKVKTKTSGSIASLISELFRTLPDKRYSVKNLITATGAMTRDEKDEVRSVVRSCSMKGRSNWSRKANTASATQSARLSKGS